MRRLLAIPTLLLAAGCAADAPSSTAGDWRVERDTIGDMIVGVGAFDVGPSIPDAKPAFQEIYAGERGRIWVQRHTAAVKVEAEARKARPGGPPPITWEEPAVFDVFDRDGTYLGEVHAPPRTTLMAFRGDTVWGVRRGEFDEPYVVRFRVDHE